MTAAPVFKMNTSYLGPNPYELKIKFKYLFWILIFCFFYNPELRQDIRLMFDAFGSHYYNFHFSFRDQNSLANVILQIIEIIVSTVIQVYLLVKLKTYIISFYPNLMRLWKTLIVITGVAGFIELIDCNGGSSSFDFDDSKTIVLVVLVTIAIIGVTFIIGNTIRRSDNKPIAALGKVMCWVSIVELLVSAVAACMCLPLFVLSGDSYEFDIYAYLIKICPYIVMSEVIAGVCGLWMFASVGKVLAAAEEDYDKMRLEMSNKPADEDPDFKTENTKLENNTTTLDYNESQNHNRIHEE